MWNRPERGRERLKKLKPIGVVDFLLHGHVAHDHRLMELGSVMEEVTVVGFVGREICKS